MRVGQIAHECFDAQATDIHTCPQIDDCIGRNLALASVGSAERVIVAWAYSSKRKQAFDAAARMSLEDDEPIENRSGK